MADVANLRVHALMPFETDQRAHRHAELSDLLGAAQIGQIDDEAGRQNIGADLQPKCQLGHFSIIQT
jgi:hypothetical protein